MSFRPPEAIHRTSHRTPWLLARPVGDARAGDVHVFGLTLDAEEQPVLEYRRGPGGAASL